MISESILSKELIEVQSTLRPQNLFNIQNRSEYCGQHSEYELEFKNWDSVTNRKIKTKIQIISTKENMIKYTLDGQILRIDQGRDLPLRNQVWNNFEQIKYLAWFEEIGKSNQKSSKWIAIWKGEVLSNVGGYIENNLKQGLWNQLIDNYWSQAQVFQSGEYCNNYKIGTWKYIYNQKIIGGGQFNQFGQKNGKWIELCKGFYHYSQVTYSGEYKNGNKIGRWDIWHHHHRYHEDFGNKQIGGGFYNVAEIGSIKNGWWIEISDGFDDFQVTYHGQYKNGNKIGKWDILYHRDDQEQRSEQMQLCEHQILVVVDFMKRLEKVQLKMGDGLRQAKDLIMIPRSHIMVNTKMDKKLADGIFILEIKNQNNFNRCGGSYGDQIEGYSVKIGRWIELSDGFWIHSQITYEGDYQNGEKIGRWNTYWNYEGNNSQLGGGYYREGIGSDCTKNGIWIELSDRFWCHRQVIFKGVYKNGKKIGKWETYYKEKEQEEYKQIGGGSYQDQIEGNSIKIGKWTDLSDEFYNQSEVSYRGEYKNGQRIGKWDICFKKKNQVKLQYIGGGSYIEQTEGVSSKIGRWIELNDEFVNFYQISYFGQYIKNGQKFGKWDIFYRENYQEELLQIGGGSYDIWIGGSSIKVGMWIELNDRFKWDLQVIEKGEYKNGKKFGRWDTFFRLLWQQEFNQIGGGSYYDSAKNGSIKIGKWIELSDRFASYFQVICRGEYTHGRKVGIWVEEEWKRKWLIEEIKYDYQQ
ncbi:unnamed protein product [Paramecium primaurelia]|uniref:Uncharacterized protein n=1 Tax=Paramecium primaurelia TaxID=5886 RepID=A0A8S1Q4E4_PARPR|nr:unnamed protein product [Paramecium primaurelia]